MERNIPKDKFDERIRWLESISDTEMDAILSVLIRRYSALFPENEMVCMFLPKKDVEQRKQILQLAMEFLLRHSSEDRK